MGRRSKSRDKKQIELDNVAETVTKNENIKTTAATLIDKYDWEKLSYFVGIITVILSGGYVVINNVYTITYQRDCEDFYKIPGQYFYNSIDNKALFVMVLILCIFIFFSPTIIKRYIQKKGGYNKITMYVYVIFLTLIFGFVLGLINTLNLLTVLDKVNTVVKIPNVIIQWINDHASFIMWIVVVLATLTILMFCLVREVGKIKYKKLKTIIAAIGIVSYFITAILFISAAEIKLTYSIKDKKKYETVIVDSKNMAVLSTVNDKFLVVEYSLKDEEITFMTSNYMLIDKCNIMLTYKEFTGKPKIISNGP